MYSENARLLASRIATLPTHWISDFPLVLDERGVAGRFFKCELRSHFEYVTVGSLSLPRAKLLATGPDGEAFPVPRLFQLCSGEDGMLKLDRLCRLIHALNHFIVGSESCPLVLTVHPHLFEHVRREHGRTFARLLAHFELKPASILLELPRGLPEHVLDGYLKAGFCLRPPIERRCGLS